MTKARVTSEAPKEPRSSVWGILQNKKDEYLLLKRSSKVRNPNLWNMPGGNIEPGETPEQALVHELLEEAGLHITSANMVYDSQLTTDGRVMYFYRVVGVKLKGITLNEESSARVWVKREKVLKRNLHVPTKLYFQHLAVQDKQAKALKKISKMTGLKAKLQSLAATII